MRRFLPEVQALRALAVMLVVLYHLWPHRLTGGYVGVDVFFVISGFLITSHLHRELESWGTVSLANFYARRARRLLPAALLVLVVTAVATYFFAPATRWATSAHDTLASTFYVQNWSLATRAVEYSASDDAASAMQHYWSLSVEEQFYLAWPPLIVLLVVLARRIPRLRDRDLVLPGIVAVTLASLAYSVYATAYDPAAAYFVTPTRIWELGVGAVLAFVLRARAVRPGGPQGQKLGRRGLVALRWAGAAAIAVAAVSFSSATPFPGYTALLPVLGAAAVIAAGDTGRRDPLSPLVSLRPTQFLGNVSYPLYLWHWPLIVLAPFVLARPLTTVDKALLLLVAVVLAWGTKRLVEDQAQAWRRLRRPVFTACLTATAMLLVAGVAAAQLYAVGRAENRARADLTAAQDDLCFGAASMAPGAVRCGHRFGPPASLTMTPDDQPWFLDEPACTVMQSGLVDCRFHPGPPSRRVALVGDSHAEHWRGALHRIAAERNWEIVEILRGGCPMNPTPVLTFDGAPSDTATCTAWQREAEQLLAAEHVDDIFTSSFTPAYGFEGGIEAGARGFSATWTGWADAGAQVFVLRDVPTTGKRDIPECLATNPADPLRCSRPRSEAVRADAATLAAARVHSADVHFLDLTDFFCDSATCYAAVGGAVVYWDRDHMSGQFSRTLAPYLLERMGGGPG